MLSALHVATITFKRVASGETAIAGYVVETLTSGGLLGEADRAIVAGAATLVVNVAGGGRRLRPNAELATAFRREHERRKARWQQGRSLKECSEVVFGDITGDCKFTLSDLARLDSAEHFCVD